jgi:hypothetical protein
MNETLVVRILPTLSRRSFRTLKECFGEKWSNCERWRCVGKQFENKKTMTSLIVPPKKNGALRALSVSSLSAGLAIFAAMPRPAFSVESLFDWGIRNEGISSPGIVPVPHVGHDYVTPAGSLPAVYANLYTSLHNQGKPIGLMLREGASPYDGTKDKNALANTISWLKSKGWALDYCFSDFENATTRQSVVEMVRLIRSDSSTLIKNAGIGQYAYYSGALDYSQHFKNLIDRTEYDNYYRTGGLNVAQPNCYPYNYFSAHTMSSQWGANVAPNNRSAMLWAPLERYSLAKRTLPSGHKVFPWLAGYVYFSSSYTGEAPGVDDRRALVQHIRLRLPDGYYILNSGITGLSNEDYRTEVYNAYHAYDWFFNQSGTKRCVNLDTSKVDGVQWSAMQNQTNKRTVVRLSNLGNASAQINYRTYLDSATTDLPAKSPVISAGNHATLTYLANWPMNRDFQADGAGTLLSSLGWKGPQPTSFVVASSSEPAAGSDRVVNINASSVSAWWSASNPGFLATDKALYSARLRGGANVAFAPINADGSFATTAAVPNTRSGPSFGISGTAFELRQHPSSGVYWQATNASAASGSWYETEVLIDPSAKVARVFVRNLSSGGGFVQLVFDDRTTSGTVEAITNVPLDLGTGYTTTSFNGWQISGNANGKIDTLRADVYPYIDGLQGAVDLTLLQGSGAGASKTFNATADAMCDEISPATNFGTSRELAVKYVTSRSRNSYLRFNVTGVAGKTVTRVRLRLKESTLSSEGDTRFDVRKVTGSWTETGVNWNNKPALAATVYGTAGGKLPNGLVLDVLLNNSLITGDGTYDLALFPTGMTSNDTAFFAREGGQAPQLIIEHQ